MSTTSVAASASSATAGATLLLLALPLTAATTAAAAAAVEATSAATAASIWRMCSLSGGNRPEDDVDIISAAETKVVAEEWGLDSCCCGCLSPFLR